MLTADFVPLRPILPLVILAGSIVLILLVSSFSRNRVVSFFLSSIGLIASFAALFGLPARTQAEFLLRVDPFAAYYMGLIFLSSLAILILSNDYARFRGSDARAAPEYSLVLLLATLGSAVLVASTHFASFFIGLEILSVSLYVLIAFLREQAQGAEAGAKYLVLAGSSSSFLLFGMALVYFSAGTMEFTRIAAALPGGSPGVAVTGFALILVGIGFKLALAPFHMWSPDIYEGAPAPVTAFVATVSKGGMLALTVRIFQALTPGQKGASSGTLLTLLTLLAIASMFVGNLAALRQKNVKRLLAYSSIAHLGYLLVALLAGPGLGPDAIAFYLLAYFATTIAAFGVVSALSSPGRDADRIEDFQGLFWKKPFLGVVFFLSMLSLAGIPLTAGFVGKFFVITAGVGGALWALVLILVANSAIALYYYLRLILALFESPRVDTAAASPERFGQAPSLATLAVLSALMIGLGIYPSPVLRLIRDTIPSVRSR